jgi:hypothetical protein
VKWEVKREIRAILAMDQMLVATRMWMMPEEFQNQEEMKISTGREAII